MSMSLSHSNEQSKPRPPTASPDIIRNYQQFKRRIQSARRLKRARPSATVSEVRHYPLAYHIPEPDFRQAAKRPPLSKSPQPQLPRDTTTPVKSVLNQIKSMDRLKGVDSGQNSVSRPVNTDRSKITFASILQVELTEDEKALHKQFKKSLGELRPLKFDLNINHDTIRDNKSKATGFSKGSYLEIQECLQDLIQQGIPQEQNTSELIKQFRLFSRVIREILTSLISENAIDQAILLELVWKSSIKSLDTTLQVHQNILDKIQAENSEYVEKIKSKHIEAVTKLQEQLSSSDSTHAKEIQKLNEIVDSLQKSKETLEQTLSKRDSKIAQMGNIDFQNKEMKSMNSLMGQLDRFISETELTRRKQMITLQEISTVMALTEQLDVPPEVIGQSTQTDWSLMEDFQGVKLGKLELKSDSDLHSFIRRAQLEHPETKKGVSISDRTLYTL